LPAAAVLFLLSCASVIHRAEPIPPKQAGVGAWDRLAKLESFTFTLSFHTDMPFPIEVRFTGRREQPDREVWSGTMRRRSEESRVELRAEGTDQYEKEQSGWNRTIRGIETRILEQGEGAFRGRSLEFAGTVRGRYSFSFVPDLPILDPTRTKKLTGVMEVDPRSGLPSRLYCSDSAKTAEWELTLSRFNRAGKVDVPYLPAMTVDARPLRPLNRADADRTLEILNQRLAKLGWDHRLGRTRSGFSLMLGQPKTRRQVDLLFSRGRVEVWQARWVPPEEPAGTAPVLEVGTDASRRVVLVRSLGENERIGAIVRASTPISAALETSLAVMDTSGPVVLLLDRTALSAARPGQDGRIAFEELGNEDEVRIIAALAAGGVIPADLAIAVKP
jgi:hypothetical protein